MKSIKKLCAFVLVLAAMLAMASVAFAAETPSITFDGTNVNFQFGSEYTDTDLFDGFKGVMPGDELKQEIIFTNNAKKYDYVKVYLSVKPHTDAVGGELGDDGNQLVADGANPMSENVAALTTFKDMVDFLNQLTMQVYHNDKNTKNADELIYEADIGELGNLEKDNIYLGKFSYNETSTITVNLQVPLELDNSYAKKIGEVDWVITVEGYTDDGGGGSDGGKKVTVRKVWVGDNENDRPESIKVNLLNKNGKLVETVTLSKANNWTYTLKDELEWVEVKNWTMEEVDAPEGYTVTTSKDNKSGTIILTVTNSKGGGGPKDPEDPNNPPGGGPEDPNNPSNPGGDSGKPGDIGSTDTIVVNKVWSGDAASKRPESVSFTLYQNGVAYDVITVGEWNNWTYTWKELDMNERWQVVETEIAGYEAGYSLDGNVLTVTNVANSPETLLKTGQVNWPVLALGGAGALMMLAGVFMLAGKKRQNAR